MWVIFSTSLAVASMGSYASATKITASSRASGQGAQSASAKDHQMSIDYQALIQDFVNAAEIDTFNDCQLAFSRSTFLDHEYIAIRNRNCLSVEFVIELDVDSINSVVAVTGKIPEDTLDTPDGLIQAYFSLEMGETFGMMVGPSAGRFNMNELTAEPFDLDAVDNIIAGSLERQYDAEHDCSYLIGTFTNEFMYPPTPISVIVNYDCPNLEAKVYQYEWDYDSDIDAEFGIEFESCEYVDTMGDEECDLPTIMCKANLKNGQLKMWQSSDPADNGIIFYESEVSAKSSSK